MSRSTPRISILRTRIGRLRRVLPGIALRKPAAVHAARKLMRRLRKAGRQLGRVRDIDIQAELLDPMIRRDGSARSLRELRDALGPLAERQWNELPAAKLVARLNRLIKQLSDTDEALD